MTTPCAPLLFFTAALGAILVDAVSDSSCAADVTGEAVTEARCRATCLQKFATLSGSDDQCGTDCVMCWDHCGMLKRSPSSVARVCKDSDRNRCYAGCRAACDFHFPRSAGRPSPHAPRSLRPTADSAAGLRLHALPPPQLDDVSLRIHWLPPRVPRSTPASQPRPSEAPAASSPAPAVAPVRALDNIVYVVSAKNTPSLSWKVLSQTVDPWLELSASQRRGLRAVSVLAVSPDGPVARAWLCLPPHQQDDGHDEDDAEVEGDEEEADQDLSPEVDADTEASGNIIHMLAHRSFQQLRADHESLQDDDDYEEDEDWPHGMDSKRLDLAHRILGSHGISDIVVPAAPSAAPKAEAGWQLRLLGVWSGAGGARLPRARVAWTPPHRAIDEVLVRWAVPALGISGSRVVTGVAQAEVPIVEQHATRVTVGNAHDVSAALVLRLSVQTDTSGSAAEILSSVEMQQQQQQQQQHLKQQEMLQRDHQAALWEATLVAVGLVVGAAALCVALLVVAYGVHHRIARFCSRAAAGSSISGIHSKSSSVVPLNDPNV